MGGFETAIQVVAEVGCNHKGDLDLAKEMIRVAALDCGVDVVKFQKRCNRELLSPAQYNAPHPNPAHAYGASYGAHRECLEFDRDQHLELLICCAEQGVTYSTSVWDLTSARDMVSLSPAMLKVPSASNQHYAMQTYLCEQFPGEIHVSLGMTTAHEIASLMRFYAERGRMRDLVLYACTSGYPVDYSDVCLFEIRALMELYGAQIKGIGFSGHHLGTAPDMAALALGRAMQWDGHGNFTHIERHFTLDRSWKGTDHAASLEPADLRDLCAGLHQVDQALAYKEAEVLPVEHAQREKLKWAGQRFASAAE